MMQHLQLVLTTFSEGNSAFGTGWIFNTNPHSSFWYWRKKQKQTTTELKICHNSDLKITKCTSGFPLVENGLWKTLWKVWKSTLKRGVSAGLLHVLHRVFNLWKKQGGYTDGKAVWMWKTFTTGKKTDNRRAKGNTSPMRRCPGGRHRNFTGRKSAILWQTPAAYVILQDEL